MAGLTQDELIKQALILLYEAGNSMNAALSYAKPGTLRSFPCPETRQHIRQVRLIQRELEHNWLPNRGSQWQS